MKDGNFYAAPTATVDDVYAQRSWGDVAALATRSSRLWAVIVDSLPFVIFGGIAGGLAVALEAGGGGSDALYLGIIAFGGLLVLGLMGINLYLLHDNGQTIGKKLMGIKIVRSDRVSRASLGRILFFRIFIVSLLGAIPFIGSFVQLGNCLMIFRDDQRCLHDHIADTVVIVADATSGSAASTW